MTESLARVDRYQDGWRAGKPVEDPDKLKRWGFVTARPSEYLVCTRRGQIDRRRSGQGARVFKWPWESIAIVPTTLQRIEFAADQITRERVGVTVAGVAVYRIAEPELAFRVLNFTFGEAANEKLAATLREMFIGASRRLIANLTLDECLTRRKEAIGSFLMQEIAPVVGGTGATTDATDRGWGVVLDTIEIQDVQIQSQQVFAHLQAPYRAEIAARAERAELERRAEALERKEALARREIEMQEAVAVRKAESEAAVARRAAQLDRERVLAQIKIAEEQRRAHADAEVLALQAEAARAEASHAEEVRTLERSRASRTFTQATELDLKRAEAVAALDLRAREVETRAAESELEAAHQRRLAEVELLIGGERTLRELVTRGLPQIASAFQQSFGEIHYTQVGSGEGPGAPIAQAFAQVLAVARSFGLDPAALTRPRQ